MKKIATLALLPAIALASCGKEEAQTPVNVETLENQETQTLENQETQTSEVLNENITQTANDGATTTEQAFNFNYEIGGNQVPVSGRFVLENGVITDMIINGADINGESPVDKFAKDAPSQVIGKSLSGLKIDSVSGASYVTIGFNDFLSTLQ